MRNQENVRRAVRCPLCQKGRLLDVAVRTDLPKLILYGPSQSELSQIFLKCPKCGQQIGLAIE